jgi:hypothetical protein
VSGYVNDVEFRCALIGVSPLGEWDGKDFLVTIGGVDMSSDY